jgi:hypothetical protein
MIYYARVGYLLALEYRNGSNPDQEGKWCFPRTVLSAQPASSSASGLWRDHADFPPFPVQKLEVWNRGNEWLSISRYSIIFARGVLEADDLRHKRAESPSSFSSSPSLPTYSRSQSNSWLNKNPREPLDLRSWMAGIRTVAASPAKMPTSPPPVAAGHWQP